MASFDDDFDWDAAAAAATEIERAHFGVAATADGCAGGRRQGPGGPDPACARGAPDAQGGQALALGQDQRKLDSFFTGSRTLSAHSATLELDFGNDAVELDEAAASTWIYPANMERRDYQYDITERALLGNTLVCLPTGLGKTFVAAVVMYNFLRWFPKGKVVFVAPTRPLAGQQIKAVQRITHFPEAKIVLLTGEVPPAERRHSWQSSSAFFLTPQTLQKDIESGSCPYKKVTCLIVDEAHHAVGQNSARVVAKKLLNAGIGVRIIGLTATPAFTADKVQDIIDTLCISHIEYRSLQSVDVQKYIHHKHHIVHEVDVEEENMPITRLLMRLLQPHVNVLRSYGLLDSRPDLSSFHSWAFVLAQKQATVAQNLVLTKGQRGDLQSRIAVCTSLALANERLRTHGPKAAHDLLTEKPARNPLSRVKNERDMQEAVRLLSLRAAQSPNQFPKMQKLEEVIVEHFQAHKEETRAMVFIKYRSSVMDIVHLLNKHDSIKAEKFIGQSHGKDKGQTQKEQKLVEERFRRGEFNVLVATSIGEEGLDIAEGMEKVKLSRKMESSKHTENLMRFGGQFERRASPRMIPFKYGTPQVRMEHMKISEYLDTQLKGDTVAPTVDPATAMLTLEERNKLQAYFQLDTSTAAPYQPCLNSFPRFQRSLTPVGKVEHSGRCRYMFVAILCQLHGESMTEQLSKTKPTANHQVHSLLEPRACSDEIANQERGTHTFDNLEFDQGWDQGSLWGVEGSGFEESSGPDSSRGKEGGECTVRREDTSVLHTSDETFLRIHVSEEEGPVDGHGVLVGNRQCSRMEQTSSVPLPERLSTGVEQASEAAVGDRSCGWSVDCPWMHRCLFQSSVAGVLPSGEVYIAEPLVQGGIAVQARSSDRCPQSLHKLLSKVELSADINCGMNLSQNDATGHGDPRVGQLPSHHSESSHEEQQQAREAVDSARPQAIEEPRQSSTSSELVGTPEMLRRKGYNHLVVVSSPSGNLQDQTLRSSQDSDKLEMGIPPLTRKRLKRLHRVRDSQPALYESSSQDVETDRLPSPATRSNHRRCGREAARQFFDEEAEISNDASSEADDDEDGVEELAGFINDATPSECAPSSDSKSCRDHQTTAAVDIMAVYRRSLLSQSPLGSGEASQGNPIFSTSPCQFDNRNAIKMRFGRRRPPASSPSCEDTRASCEDTRAAEPGEAAADLEKDVKQQQDEHSKRLNTGGVDKEDNKHSDADSVSLQQAGGASVILESDEVVFQQGPPSANTGALDNHVTAAPDSRPAPSRTQGHLTSHAAVVVASLASPAKCTHASGKVKEKTKGAGEVEAPTSAKGDAPWTWGQAASTRHLASGTWRCSADDAVCARLNFEAMECETSIKSDRRLPVSAHTQLALQDMPAAGETCMHSPPAPNQRNVWKDAANFTTACTWSCDPSFDLGIDE
eukprot:SM000100S09385  [mRNA]  locus=s100:56635:65447:- [translate_table: standard]